MDVAAHKPSSTTAHSVPLSVSLFPIANMRRVNVLDQSELLDLFHYFNGSFYWREPRRGMSADFKAGGVRPDGYSQVTLNKKSYYLHNLIWIYFNGEITKGLEVDHIDNNRRNNTIENLQLLTHSDNLRKRPYIKGSVYRKKQNLDIWIAKYRQKYVGSFKSKELALAAINLLQRPS